MKFIPSEIDTEAFSRCHQKPSGLIAVFASFGNRRRANFGIEKANNNAMSRANFEFDV